MLANDTGVSAVGDGVRGSGRQDPGAATGLLAAGPNEFGVPPEICHQGSTAPGAVQVCQLLRPPSGRRAMPPRSTRRLSANSAEVAQKHLCYLLRGIECLQSFCVTSTFSYVMVPSLHPDDSLLMEHAVMELPAHPITPY